MNSLKKNTGFDWNFKNVPVKHKKNDKLLAETNIDNFSLTCKETSFGYLFELFENGEKVIGYTTGGPYFKASDVVKRAFKYMQMRCPNINLEDEPYRKLNKKLWEYKNEKS